MQVLKILKILCLLFFSSLLVLTATLFLVNNSLKFTLFSSGYFNKVFNQNIKPENIEKTINDVLNNAESFMPLSEENKRMLESGEISPEAKKQIESAKLMLKENVDTEWLKQELPKLLEGTFAYFTYNSESIPLVDIGPLKNALLNIYASQIIAHGGSGSEKEIEKIIKQVKKSSGGMIKDGKLNSKAVDDFMKLDLIKAMKIERATAEKMLEKMSELDSGAVSSREVYEFTVKALIAEKMGINKMKDTLDLNELFKTVYKSGDNPVTAAREMFYSIRTDVWTLNLLIILLLFSLIGVAAFYPKSIFRWSGSIFVICGVLSIIPSILKGAIFKFIDLKYAEIEQKSSQLDVSFVEKWMKSYIGGLINFITIESIILILVGIALIVLGFYFKHKNEKSIHEGEGINMAVKSPGKKRGLIVVSRTLAFILALSLLPVTIVIFSKDIGRNIQAFNDVQKKTSESKDRVKMNEALDKVLGTKFFSAMSEDKQG